MMTTEELAARLNSREYGEELTREEELAADEHGLVVIFGASDDLVELRGAIDDELSASGGAEFLIDPEGAVPTERDDDWDDDQMAKYFERRKGAHKVEALWCEEEPYSWTYRTGLPHARFDILEDGEPFCRGIVVHVHDLEPMEEVS